MTPQRVVHLTDAEVATIRRSLVTLDQQLDDLVAGHPSAMIVVRLRGAIDGVRFLLEQAEARRDIH